MTMIMDQDMTTVVMITLDMDQVLKKNLVLDMIMNLDQVMTTVMTILVLGQVLKKNLYLDMTTVEMTILAINLDFESNVYRSKLKLKVKCTLSEPQCNSSK